MRPFEFREVGLRRPVWAALVVLAVGGLWLTTAAADCLEFPSAELRSLDGQRLLNPERAVALAETQLSAPAASSDPSTRAQLNLIIAYARGAEGRAADARAALDRARQDFARMPPGATRHVVELRLALGEFGAAKADREYRQDLARIQALLQQTQPDTLERVCLLSGRGDLQAELDRPDLAVADQLAAYRTARAHGWTSTSEAIALSLATTYRRSGLWSDAESMIGEVLAYSQQHDLTWLQAMGNFTAGQIYVNEQSWDRAFTALDHARTLALSVGDPLTAAFATLPACDALINSGRIPQARAQCAAAFSTFASMGRSDLMTDSMIYSARIDLLDQHYVSALSTLDTVLNHRIDDVPARYKARLYRERADALQALHRYRAAAADLERSVAAADATALAARARTVAVLTGIANVKALESANQALTIENREQRQQLQNQLLVRRLSVGLASAGLLGSGLFACLLYLTHRHRRALEQRAATLHTLTNNLTDTVMLIGRDQRIEFANRALFGGTGSTVGALDEVVPAEAREQFRSAISSVIDERLAVDFEATLRDSQGRRQHFEQRATPILTDGLLIGVTLRSTDMTLRRELEDELRLQARILNTMNEGVFVIDDDDKITYANSAMHELLHCAADQLLGLGIASISLTEPELQRWRERTEGSAAHRLEMTLRRRDGTECLVSLASSRLVTGDQASLVCVCRDISEQRSVERALAYAAGREALRVGSALHEGLAQELAGLSLLASSLSRPTAGADLAQGQSARDMTSYLTSTIRGARELARLLSPMSTVSGSLATALEGLTADTARHLGIPVPYLRAANCPSIEGVTADEIYRIAEAALRYAAGRRDCSHIAVDLATESGSLTLTVSWEGLERHAQPAEKDGLELQIIHYRTRLLGGFCEQRVWPPNRETMTVAVPLTYQ